MVESYYNPLDTAPVRRGAHAAGYQKYERPSRMSGQDLSFEQVLEAQKTQSSEPAQKPTPILNPSHLRNDPAPPASQPSETQANPASHGQQAAQPSSNPAQQAKQPQGELQGANPANLNLRSILERYEMQPNETGAPAAQPQAAPEAVTPATPPARETDNAAATKAVEPAAAPEAVESTPAPASANTRYTVKPGDTLSEIVASAMRESGIRFNTTSLYRTVDQVARVNGLSNPDRIYAGQDIDLSVLYNNEITQAGSSAQTSAVSEDGYQPSVRGAITSEFGMRIHPIFGYEHHHNGVDIAAPTGTDVFPVQGGRVIFSGERSGYGNTIEVEHPDGNQSLYAHLNERSVKVGDMITTADSLGKVGETGTATGPHLHLEIHQAGRPIDPLSVIPASTIAIR